MKGCHHTAVALSQTFTTADFLATNNCFLNLLNKTFILNNIHILSLYLNWSTDRWSAVIISPPLSLTASREPSAQPIVRHVCRGRVFDYIVRFFTNLGKPKFFLNMSFVLVCSHRQTITSYSRAAESKWKEREKTNNLIWSWLEPDVTKLMFCEEGLSNFPNIQTV